MSNSQRRAAGSGALSPTTLPSNGIGMCQFTTSGASLIPGTWAHVASAIAHQSAADHPEAETVDDDEQLRKATRLSIASP